MTVPTERVLAFLSLRLSRLRVAQSLSQEEVANRAGIAVSTYRRLEALPTGTRTSPAPSLDTVWAVFQALETDEAVLAAVRMALQPAAPPTDADETEQRSERPA
jgi:transcriptional regulator with XRE-family HTH domain